jgi:hypothetical protein
MEVDSKDMERGNIFQSLGGRVNMPYLEKRRSNYARKLSWYFFAEHGIKSICSYTISRTTTHCGDKYWKLSVWV